MVHHPVIRQIVLNAAQKAFRWFTKMVHFATSLLLLCLLLQIVNLSVARFSPTRKRPVFDLLESMVSNSELQKQLTAERAIVTKLPDSLLDSLLSRHPSRIAVWRYLGLLCLCFFFPCVTSLWLGGRQSPEKKTLSNLLLNIFNILTCCSLFEGNMPVNAV
jgi:hypothetical protein